MAITRRLARPLLASTFLVGSFQVLKDPTPVLDRARGFSEKVAPWARSQGIPLPEDPALLARLHAATQLTAAAALVTGKAPRLSAAVLAASLVPSTAAALKQESADPSTTRRDQVQHAARNASLVGGLVLASLDTEGRPGVAWRTRRAARDARRQARHLARTARLEAKLATKSATGAIG